MLKAEVIQLLAVAVVLVGLTVLSTDGDRSDWRFVGFFLLAYIVLGGVKWWWQSRKHERAS